MADPSDESQPDRAQSPHEDFDPLSDDGRLIGGAYGEQPSLSPKEDYYDYIEAQLEHTEHDEEGPESLGSRYGATPPQPRTSKREKERQANALRGSYVKRSYKEFKDYKDAKRKTQPRAVLNVIKDAHLGDPTLCKLSGFDSDDNIDLESFREKKDKRKRDSVSKKQTKSRDHDRFMKRMSGDFTGLDVGSMAQVPVNLESSGRFSHLMTKPVIAVSPDNRTRQQWTEPAECPQDRKMFSQTFGMLIKLGTQAKMDKERKLASTKRQMSSEVEQWKSQLMDIMWYEVNAYLHGCSPEDEQTNIRIKRDEVETVLNDIINFRFRASSSPSQPSSDYAFCTAGASVVRDVDSVTVSESVVAGQPCYDSAASIIAHPTGEGGEDVHQTSEDCNANSKTTFTFSVRETSVDVPVVDSSRLNVNVLMDDSVSASFHDIALTAETVQLQKEALVKVQELVDRLDACERLYPSMKQVANEYPLYGEPSFTRRVKCLNLWLNITCDLCHKLKLFGRIIGVEQHGIDWPIIDFDFPFYRQGDHNRMQRPSVPNIMEDCETSESDVQDDEDANDTESAVVSDADRGRGEGRYLSPSKQVKFTFGSDSTTSSRDTSPNQRGMSSVVDPSSPVETSTPNRNSRSSMGSFATTLSRASSDVSLDGLGRSAVYRHYVDKCLKKMGMQRLVIRLRDIFNCTLQRAKEALEGPRNMSQSDLKRYPSDDTGIHENEMASSPSLGKARLYFGRSTSLAEHGEWCQEFRRMGLPSFRPSYLFLVRVPLDVVHECLRLRLEQRPQGDPSFLSIRQLIRECKEVLYAATVVKQYYQFMVDPVMWDEQEAEEKFASDLDQFDYDLKSMLEVYFSFLQSWIYMLQSLPEGSQDLKSALEDEWEFTRSICIYIIGGEAEAGKRFSSLASSLLSSTADFLDNGIDENTRSLYDVSGLEDDEEEEVESNDNNNNNDSAPSIECDDYPARPRISAEVKQSVQVALRNFKNLFHEARERATKALGFAKKLRKDLEIAADFDVTVTMTELFDKLKETDHVRVRAPLSAGYIMFVPQRIVGNTRVILQLLNVTSGRDDSTNPADMSSTREEGYLLLIRCEAGTDHLPACPLWKGEDVIVEPTAETAIALSHIQVEGLLYVVIRSSSLGSQRKDFHRLMGNTIALIYEQTPCHQAIAESLSEVKLYALELQEKVAGAIRQVDDKLNFNDIIQHEDNLLKLYRETMLQCYNFGFEYSKEVMRLISSDQRRRQCQTLIAFAGDWMTFVLQKCERGRGTRPRWATHGLDFLTSVCDPKFLAYLNNEEFEKFKQNISDCLTHVIGNIDQRPIAHGISMMSKSSLELRQPIQRFVSWPEQTGRFQRSTSARSVSSEPSSHFVASGLSTPSTPSPQPETRSRRLMPESHSEVSIHDGLDGGLVLDIHHPKHRAAAHEAQVYLSRQEKIQRNIQQLEKGRDSLLREKNRIGRVANKVREPDYRINVRRVNFRWQRGNKIGEGQFGKVYTAVNMSTGELMAIKEMKFQPNDLQQLRQMCDEIKIFEGIQHPNLVKYYGVEVHKDEMLMFMEYCDTCTIEEAAKMGLPEYLIRRYTREIVLAVNHLHENSIVHRDIKGANIFVTSNGHVKLGDFGCSVKLKSLTTMPGEFHNLVGTTAYMAPEVITQSGYGRAADIWSLGCVVIEMATGKRPWHELENNYQIMFKVGMGFKPVAPDNLSPEGKAFLDRILCQDPSVRPTANDLLDHTFTKVYNEPEDEEEDEKSKRKKHHLLPKGPS